MTRVVIAIALAATAFGQAPAFEVASVRPNDSRDGHSDTNISADSDAMKLTMRNVSMLNCIQRAYGVRAYQIEGPDWLKSEAYDIIGTVPLNVPKERLWLMLQTLLADRFKLKLHRETRVLPIYELVVGKNGPKIAPVEPGGSSGTWQGTGQLTAKKEPLADFASVLSRILDRPVVNKTNLDGVFDFVVEYSPDDSQSMHRSQESTSSSSPPSIFTSLQEKLGLKLEAKKGPVEILVIDHLEKVPTDN